MTVARRPIDADRLASDVAEALVGARSVTETCDACLAELARALGPTARLSVHVLDGEHLWLQAQHGYDSVIHLLPVPGGIYARAAVSGETQLVLDPAADPACVHAIDGVTAVVGAPFRVDETVMVLGLELVGGAVPEGVDAALAAVAARLGEALAQLSPRAREAGALTQLTRTFVRIAGQRSVDGLLELTCRSLGAALGLDGVQAFTGAPTALRSGALWRREPEAPTGIAEAEATPLIAELGWEAVYASASPDLHSRPRLRALHDRGLGTVAVFPLRAGGELLGCLVGWAGAPRGVDLELLDQAELLVAHAATALGNLRLYETVVSQSLTDALTGLPNHRRFHEDGAALLEAARASGAIFSVVVADLDDFKDLNDRRGHVVGDDALRLVGALLERGVRPDDRAYRVGGEEFGVLLPNTSKRNARTVCRRLQRSLAQVDLDGWKLTQSIGVATYPEDGESIRDLLAAADAALYEAKRLGKDRITVATEMLSARRTQQDTMAVRGRRSFEQMRHLQALATSLAAAHTQQEVAQSLLRELALALPHDLSRVYSTGPDGSVEAVLALRGGRQDAAVERALLALAGRTREAGRSLLIDDAGDEFPELGAAGLHGLLVSPLVAEDRIVGAVAVANAIRARYDRDDQRLLEVISHLGGLAAENLRLLADRSAAADAAEAALALGERLVACRSLEEVGRVGLDVIHGLVHSDRAAFRWLRDAEGELLLVDAGDGEPARLVAPDEGVIWWEALARRVGEGGTRVVAARSLAGLGEPFPLDRDEALMLLPLRSAGVLDGVIALTRSGGGFTDLERQLLERLAAQIGLAMTSWRLFGELEETLAATVEALARSVEIREGGDVGSRYALARLAGAVGRRLGLDDERVEDLRHAAALHDVGKLAVPPEILQKAGSLDPEELEVVHRHAAWGARILDPIPRLRSVVPLVRHSHERWDGAGYPDGLAGAAIPLGARILAVCDAFDAMTSTRPFRAARSAAAALTELQACAGSQFDPAVVAAFADVYAGDER